MNQQDRAELEALLALKRTFLRSALAIAGGTHSSSAATTVAGAEAGKLKAEIAEIERTLASEPELPLAGKGH